MKFRTRLAAGATAAAMTGVFGLAGTAASAAPSASQVQTVAARQQGATTLTVIGTLSGRPFTGQMSNLSASVVNGTAMLTGSLTGTGLPVAGTTFTTEINSVSAVDPVPAPPPTVPDQPECTILALDISDLRLNLLGLVILIPELKLIAGGVTGPDQLLGNVLCNLARGSGASIAPPAEPRA